MNQLLCTFEISERDQKLYDIANEYTDRTESYDRTICSGVSERDGCAMPVNGRELGLINENARKVRKSLYAENPEFSPYEINQAIKRRYK